MCTPGGESDRKGDILVPRRGLLRDCPLPSSGDCPLYALYPVTVSCT